MSLKQSIKNILELDVDKNIVDKFAREQYEKSDISINLGEGEWSYYKGYKIISENTLMINYNHGYGDMEYHASFIVDLISFYRDENLKNIL